MTALIWAAMALMGGFGAVLRFLVDRTVAGRIARSFPYGTLTVNLTGATLLGFFAGLALPAHLALIFGTGFVGSYPTFSPWMLETQRLAEERQFWLAIANIDEFMVLGLIAALIGQKIGAAL